MMKKKTMSIYDAIGGVAFSEENYLSEFYPECIIMVMLKVWLVKGLYTL
jgi:hypothetical protein